MAKQTELLSAATAVLTENRRGTYTMPAPHLYPHQWLWDSCFIAIGLRHIDMAQAQAEIYSLLDGQWHNGMLPHMIFNSSLEYEADRRIWHSSINPDSPDHLATTGITQPPLLAEAITRVGAKLNPAERRSWYKRTFPALLKYHEWLYRERDPQHTGLVVNVHPWETGLDNTPPWMELLHDRQTPWWVKAISATRTEGLAGRMRRDLRTIPMAQRYSTLDALAMLAAHGRLRRLGYESQAMLERGPFQVADAGFNAILIRNNHLLMNIAGVIDQPVPSGLRASFKQAETALEQLFDELTGQYYAFDTAGKTMLRQSNIATLLPLYAGCISKERAAHLVTKLLEDERHFGPAYPIPSVPVSSPYFRTQRYWQGPTWFNINWLIIDGLRRYGYKDHADAITEIMLELTAKHGFYEYYSPLSGRALGAKDFSWTAALTIDLLK